FDAITYRKGAAVIGMFENWVGPDEFRKGVHQYMERYAYKNASAGDFLDAISSASGKNVGQAFSTFLNQAGIPVISVALDCTGNSAELRLEQKRYLPIGSKGTTDQQWSVPFCVSYGAGGQRQTECTLLTKATDDWKLKASSCPTWLNANANGIGYYRANYEGD